MSSSELTNAANGTLSYAQRCSGGRATSVGDRQSKHERRLRHGWSMRGPSLPQTLFVSLEEHAYGWPAVHVSAVPAPASALAAIAGVGAVAAGVSTAIGVTAADGASVAPAVRGRFGDGPASPVAAVTAAGAGAAAAAGAGTVAGSALGAAGFPKNALHQVYTYACVRE